MPPFNDRDRAVLPHQTHPERTGVHVRASLGPYARSRKSKGAKPDGPTGMRYYYILRSYSFTLMEYKIRSKRRAAKKGHFRRGCARRHSSVRSIATPNPSAPNLAGSVVSFFAAGAWARCWCQSSNKFLTYVKGKSTPFGSGMWWLFVLRRTAAVIGAGLNARNLRERSPDEHLAETMGCEQRRQPTADYRRAASNHPLAISCEKGRHRPLRIRNLFANAADR
jgi:hypothetical protein